MILSLQLSVSVAWLIVMCSSSLLQGIVKVQSGLRGSDVTVNDTLAVDMLRTNETCKGHILLIDHDPISFEAREGAISRKAAFIESVREYAVIYKYDIVIVTGSHPECEAVKGDVLVVICSVLQYLLAHPEVMSFMVMETRYSGLSHLFLQPLESHLGQDSRQKQIVHYLHFLSAGPVVSHFVGHNSVWTRKYLNDWTYINTDTFHIDDETGIFRMLLSRLDDVVDYADIVQRCMREREADSEGAAWMASYMHRWHCVYDIVRKAGCEGREWSNISVLPSPC